MEPISTSILEKPVRRNKDLAASIVELTQSCDAQARYERRRRSYISIVTAKSPFKQADVSRACNGVKAAGLPISKVVVRADEITIVTGSINDLSEPKRNPWHHEPEKS